MALERWIKQQQAVWPNAVEASRGLLARFGDVPLQDQPVLHSPVGRLTLPTPEQVAEVSRFTNETERILKEDGAKVYELGRTTINTQRDAQRAKGKPSFWYVTDGGDSRPSRLSQVAIYSDPERFFVPNTGGKNLTAQEKLVKKDAEDLRKRLKSEDIDEVIPEEASTLTEVTFMYLDETGEWLFSETYARAHNLNFVYGRTKNPTKFSHGVVSDVADVGGALPVGGVSVRSWHRGGGRDDILAVRLVMPRATR